MSAVTDKLNSIQRFDHIFKSMYDIREYRGISLGNQLKCLLISDPITEKSAASLDVHVGNMHDPLELPGLAHLCEHMLFMGSVKYPVENTYLKFIKDHSGEADATTWPVNTNYLFDVASDHFRDALDIFVQSFIAPTFDVNRMSTEIKTVEAEFQKYVNFDLNRMNQLDRSTCREDHPYNRFAAGNSKSLTKLKPEKLREELLNFYSKYYSSNLMKLCLYGKESLDELEKYAIEMFSDIPNRNLPIIDFPADLSGKDQQLVQVVPVKDMKQMVIKWIIPDYKGRHHSDPTSYLTFLVGHKGKGSLLSALKRNGLCNDLTSFEEHRINGFKFFFIYLNEMTEKGIENVEEILKLVFQYFNMLKKDKPPKWLFDEINDLGYFGFLFQDETIPIKYVSTISANMQKYPTEDVLWADSYKTKFEPEAIEQLLNYHLTPGKMKVLAISKKYEGKTDKEETWYGTKYKTMPLRKQSLEHLNNCGINKEFSLPEKNSFMPTDLTLIDHSNVEFSEFPRLIHSTESTQLWYQDDMRFFLPKVHIKFQIKNNLANKSKSNYSMSVLFTMLINESLNEYSYEANLAGYHFELNVNDYGVEVSFAGYSDKIHLLMNKIFDSMTSFQIDPDKFNVLKESYTRSLLNFEFDDPSVQSRLSLYLLIKEKGWEPQSLRTAIDAFTIEDLQNFIPLLLTENIFIKCFMYGNLTEKTALEYLNKVGNKLKSATFCDPKLIRPSIYSLSQVKLPNKSNTVYLKPNEIHKTNAISVYYQCGAENALNNALVALFRQVIHESMFNVLRTKENLGYDAYINVLSFGGVRGVEVCVSSDKFNPIKLDERVENFLNIEFEKIFQKMTHEELITHVDSLVSAQLDAPKNMSNQFHLYWNEIANNQFDFSQGIDEYFKLKNLTKDDLIKFFKEYISSASISRRKLAVYVFNSDLSPKMCKENIKGKLIEDLDKWRQSL